MGENPNTLLSSKARASTRYHWIDIAKAAAIILVVLYHVGGAGMGYLFPNEEGEASPLWVRFNQVMLPMRMPLFFVTAGMLAYKAMSRPWVRVWRPRVANLLWPYLLWSVIFAMVAGFAYQPGDTATFIIDRLQAIPLAGTAYWFLAVLVVFFVTGKLFRRWAPVVLLVALPFAAVGPSVGEFIPSGWPAPLVYVVVKVTRYAFWYFLGCYAYERISQLARLRPALLVIPGGLLFAVLTLAASHWELQVGMSFLLSVAGLVAAVGASVWAARFEWVRVAARYIAERTLPIYLLHPLLITGVVLLGVASGSLHANSALATLLTIPLSAACIAVSVLIYDRASGTRLAWAFRFPTRHE